jgi:hypothetical protein
LTPRFAARQLLLGLASAEIVGTFQLPQADYPSHCTDSIKTTDNPHRFGTSHSLLEIWGRVRHSPEEAQKPPVQWPTASLRKGSFMGWELIFVPEIVAIFVVLLLFHVDNIGRQQW